MSKTVNVLIKNYFHLGAVFLALVTGVSAFCGFGFTLAAAKRQHPNSFTQGFETGTALATRALGWGTIYAIGGVGALTFIVWKLLGKLNFVVA